MFVAGGISIRSLTSRGWIQVAGTARISLSEQPTRMFPVESTFPDDTSPHAIRRLGRLPPLIPRNNRVGVPRLA